ncbi:Thiamin diphosphate-binding protein [Piromyces finnis]|uniref:Thiamin diphosphate-binding protein n=1 Tax=Piromyces finnis TaxID=1754191 RepID=A0A1Y1V3F6_9FUNG|nr:Thiamin diphosphate-binding protein [Piromyces finnis]|eukprot:ORX46355.1 Thiamin diphosphate-binding protein [Piromyces finnis]
MDTHSDCMDYQWFFLGDYILQQLTHLGIKNIFGIPGDYILDFVHLIEKFPGIDFINTCDENGAAIAADVYARINKVGCLCITYGVGGLKTLNALANAFVEKSPVIMISGSPPIIEKSKFNNSYLLHHEITKKNIQLTMVREVTCYQAILNDPFTAITELNKAFEALKKYSKPIYIELPKDFTFKKAYNLKHPSLSIVASVNTSCNSNFTSTLWEAASEMIHLIKNSQQALVMIGLEVDRFNAQNLVMEFIERTQLPFCTTVMGKSTFGENNRLFAGCYVGKMSNKEVYNYVESCDCCIMIGVQITDTVSGMFSSKRILKNDDNIRISMDNIQINNHCYKDINMIQILDLILTDEVFQEDLCIIHANCHAYYHSFSLPPTFKASCSLSSNDDNHENISSFPSDNENGKEKNYGKDSDNKSTKGKEWKTNLPSSFLRRILDFEPSVYRPLQNDAIYRIINRWINSNTTVICDVGDPSFGTYDLFMPKGSIYINPAIYLSLGFGIPGALGACAADPERRVIAICGDGGFQMTCQEISAIARYHYHPTIIVINNNGYTTEKGLDKGIKKANTIHSWNYEKLIELVGAGRYIGNIHTEKDLDLALCHCFDMTSVTALSSNGTTYEKDIKTNTNHDTIDYDQSTQDYFYVEEKDNKRSTLSKKENTLPWSTEIVDKIYSKDNNGFVSYSEYWRSIMKKKEEDEGYKMKNNNNLKEDCPHYYNEKRLKKEEKKHYQKSSDSNLNSNNNNNNNTYYLSIIEINLNEMEMSYGSQRFITLSQQKESL